MPRKSTITVGRLIDTFLAAIRPHSAPTTISWYAGYLSRLRTVAAERTADTLTDSFVQAWLTKAYGRMSATTQHGAARAVVRMLNWAVAEGLLDRSPLKHFRKPTPSRRERMITPEEYAACLRAAADTHIKSSVRPMKDAIRFLYHTGCRPQELRIIEAKHIDDFKVTLPKELSKGKKKPRVIFMDATAKAIAATRQPQ